LEVGEVPVLSVEHARLLLDVRSVLSLAKAIEVVSLLWRKKRLPRVRQIAGRERIDVASQRIQLAGASSIVVRKDRRGLLLNFD
jgi:hypothetical protein